VIGKSESSRAKSQIYRH